MLLNKNNLAGWLCIMRHNISENGEGTFEMPTLVREQMEWCGWIVTSRDRDGAFSVRLTSKGLFVSDVEAPEWGIDSIPMVEAD